MTDAIGAVQHLGGAVRRPLSTYQAQYGQQASCDLGCPKQIDTVGQPNDPRTVIVRGR